MTTLIRPFYGNGHVVYMENWYTQPLLFKKLHQQSTGAVGTVRKNRKNIPTFDRIARPQGRIVKYTDILMCTKWSDKRDVHMLSTIHYDAEVNTEMINCRAQEPIMKPLEVHDYCQ